MGPKENQSFLYRYPFIILLGFLLTAYLPVLLPWYHLKNDLVTQNLPTRFFIAESLYSDTFPWWNPYINFGMPQFGDMNNGYWNPVIWLIAELFGYNMLSITLEEMFYLLLGGWGVYLLSRQLKMDRPIALLCGITYMSGGYVVGHLQHLCWITGTAFFPYVILCFIRCIGSPTLRNFIFGGCFTFLFIASTHPGLIIGGLYFFLFLIVYIFFYFRDKTQKVRILKTSLLFFMFGLAFSPIVLVSNWEVINQMTRGTKVSFEEALMMPTSLQSYLSLLLPLAVNKTAIFNTDISMRNMSIGLLCLAGILPFFRQVAFKNKWLLILALCFFICLSAGFFKVVFYKLFPLIGFVRLNGEYTYFVYLLLILIGGKGLNHLLVNEQRANMKKIFRFFLYLFLAFVFLSSLLIILTKDSILYFSPPLTLKSVIQNTSFWDLFLLSSIIQLVFVFLYRFYSQKSYILLIAFAHLSALTWFGLPYTGLGQVPRGKIQAEIDSFPKGIIKPYQKPIILNASVNNSWYASFNGINGFYSKQIGFPYEFHYPTKLHSVDVYFKKQPVVDFINHQSYLFLSTDTTVLAQTNIDSADIRIEQYTPTYIKASVQNKDYRYLIFLQNNYPRWKVYVNGRLAEHFTAYESFIGIQLKDGVQDIEFVFDTTSLKWILYLNLAIFLIGIIILMNRQIASSKI